MAAFPPLQSLIKIGLPTNRVSNLCCNPDLNGLESWWRLKPISSRWMMRMIAKHFLQTMVQIQLMKLSGLKPDEITKKPC